MNDAVESGIRAPRRPLVMGLAAAAVLWAVSGALRDAWTCDDAFIVFRYARNLAHGLGLVFNAGERVEGFTDLLWVLWTAPAFRLGIAPETWANLWSILGYAGAIALLAYDHGRLVARLPSPAWAAVPVAALAGAANGDWHAWATSGLETSLFTFLLVAGFVVLVGAGGNDRAFGAGVVFSLAALTRPDGALPGAVGGLFLLWRTRRIAPAVAYAAGFSALWVPAAAFRLAYYGSLVPNTYWAKSANVAWWDQGLRFLGLHAGRYGVLALGPAILLAGALRWRHESPERRGLLRDAWLPRVVLAGAIAATYTLYVARVGGDFMYARMLIPVAPFLLILFDLAWTNLPEWIPAPAALALAALPLLVPALLPRPVTGSRSVWGVANEWEYYSLRKNAETDFRGEVLKRFCAGLPVRALAFGAEIRLMYRAEIPVVVEAHGLTDPVIARAPLPARGRPGHERLPEPAYAVLDRKLDVALHPGFYERTGFPRFIPVVPIRFGPVAGFLLRWDPALVGEWRRRGARVPDFPAFLDRYADEMAGRSDEVVRRDYAKFRNFYFAHAADPAREERFRTRLGTP